MGSLCQVQPLHCFESHLQCRYKDANNMVCFNYQRIKPKMSVVVTANGAVQNFDMTGWVPYAWPAVDPDANDTIPTHMNVDMLNNYFTVSYFKSLQLIETF